MTCVSHDMQLMGPSLHLMYIMLVCKKKYEFVAYKLGKAAGRCALFFVGNLVDCSSFCAIIRYNMSVIFVYDAACQVI